MTNSFVSIITWTLVVAGRQGGVVVDDVRPPSVQRVTEQPPRAELRGQTRLKIFKTCKNITMIKNIRDWPAAARGRAGCGCWRGTRSCWPAWPGFACRPPATTSPGFACRSPRTPPCRRCRRTRCCPGRGAGRGRGTAAGICRTSCSWGRRRVITYRGRFKVLSRFYQSWSE